ncbi:MAG: polymer-forming cytoskeletal protein [Cellvibrionales bacterium]|nr:polymer-forming cytoskeletal protein [Cellvibrionales bacterium]
MLFKKSTPRAETLIARSCQIEGKLGFAGTLTIEGTVNGDVCVTAEPDSSVRITLEGVVTGQVRAPTVIINGHVTGDVHASAQLVLAQDAVVDGNVYYHLIEMEKGAQINGQMIHSPPASAKLAADRPHREDKPSSQLNIGNASGPAAGTGKAAQAATASAGKG